MSISFSGLASGLDTSSWVTSLTALKKAKVTTLEAQKTAVQTCQDALTNIKSYFSSFRSTIEKITDSKFNIASMDLFSQNIATSANVGVLTATASTDAKEGIYNIKVDKLASNTEATSAYRYKTTIVETTTAVSDSKLTDLSYDDDGKTKFIKSGMIGVTVDGVEHGIRITDSDTIGTFVNKLKNVGASAYYNEDTGIFTINSSVEYIRDIDNTGIVDALHLTGVNEGYSTTNNLQVEETETLYEAAGKSTKLSELGVTSGYLAVQANGITYTGSDRLYINSTDSIQDLIDKFAAKNIEADLVDGVFTIDDAEILTTGTTTNLAEIFGFENSEIAQNTQISSSLSHSITTTSTSVATLSTKLKDIGEGLNLANNSIFTVKNSDNQTKTITVSNDTTMQELITKFQEAGMSAQLSNDGVLLISGGTVNDNDGTSGKFDIVDILGLDSQAETAMAIGDTLTETIEHVDIADLNTKLVGDFGITANSKVKVVNGSGETNTITITSSMTVQGFMDALEDIGIASDFDKDTGVLSITGGQFTQVTGNALTKLFGSSTIPDSNTTVDSTSAISAQLKYTVTNTIQATTATTLGTLGMVDGSSVLTFDVRGETRFVTVNDEMTVGGLVAAMTSAGISATFDEDTSRITLSNATLKSEALQIAGTTLPVAQSTGFIGNITTVTPQTIVTDATELATALSTYNTIGIANADVLHELATIVNGGNECTGKTIVLTQDIDLNDCADNCDSDGWTAIGTQDHAFGGIFDGQGHTISNLYVNKDTADRVGLFGHSYGEIKNVGIENCNVTGYSHVAGLVGNCANVTNCYVNGTVTSTGGVECALLVGGSWGTITNCYTTGEVTGANYVGGLLGFGGDDGGVHNCYSMTNVKGNNYVGGLAGQCCLINNCYSTGDVTGAEFVGGLCGLAVTTITSSSSYATLVSATTTDVGSLTGAYYGSSASNNYCVEISGLNKIGNTTTYDSNISYTDPVKSVSEILGISETVTGRYISSSKMYKVNTTNVSATGGTFQTVLNVTAVNDTTFASLNMTSDLTATIHNSGGTAVKTITMSSTDTLRTFFDKLDDEGITASISNGVITMSSSTNKYIDGGIATQMGISKTSHTYVTQTQQKSSATVQFTDSYNATRDNTLAQVSVLTSGTSTLTVRDRNNNLIGTVQVSSTTKIGTMLDQLGSLDCSATIADGQISFNMTNGYKISGDVYDAVKNNVTLTYSDTRNVESSTQMSKFGITTGDIRIHNNDGTYKTITVTNSSNLGSFLGELQANGFSTNINNGTITITGTGDTYLESVSGGTNIMTKLKLGTLSKTNATIYTNTQSNDLGYTTTVSATKDTALQDIKTASGNTAITFTGNNVTMSVTAYSTSGSQSTVALTFSKTATLNDVFNRLSNLGINATIDSTGQISLASNSLIDFDLTGDLGTYLCGGTCTRSHGTVVNEATSSVKLKDLTNSSGTNLGITSGNIYVYQNGTRNIVSIDNSTTLETLAGRLSQYDIDLQVASDGTIYFTGSGNSYLATAESGASNILTKLGVNGTWSATTSSVSKELTYTETPNVVITGDTKMVELKDASGNSLGVTTGTFDIYKNGVKSTKTITSDTTVNDFVALLSGAGMSVNISSDGRINVGSTNNSYIATSETGTPSNVVSQVFSSGWNFVNVYTSNAMEMPRQENEAITENTKLADINSATYQAGYISVVRNGVQSNIELTEDETVGTLKSRLALYGFDSSVSVNGQLIIRNSGESYLKEYTGSGTASNALDILGVDYSDGDWITTNSYTSNDIDVIKYDTIQTTASRDTALADLGVTTGEYYIYKNGVKNTAMISSDTTVGDLLDTLNSFGLTASLVQNGDDTSTIKILSQGNSYISKSSSTDSNIASNVVQQLGLTTVDAVYDYSGYIQTTQIVTNTLAASESTLVSYYDKSASSKSAGILSVTVDGLTNNLSISADETIGTLLGKFQALGLEATLSSEGEILIESGFKDFTINTEGTTSHVLDNLGLNFNADFGNYAASSVACTATITTIEDKTVSAAKNADYDTTMELVNISSGTISLYRNGQRATINIDSDETFGQLRSRVNSAFADVDLVFEDGYLKFTTATEGVVIDIGATTDTSNFASICGMYGTNSNSVSSSREIYKVSGESLLMTEGLFAYGDVTAGTFVIGDETFEITEYSTLSNIISQINSSDAANATAYWDSVDGKLVIKSRSTGGSLINIEAGTSNFTHVMGLTAPDETDSTISKVVKDSQTVGENSSFSINGTYFSSTSNTVTSDVSRIEGVTINLKSISNGETVQLTIEKDKETVSNAVSDIVDAYNELMTNVDEELATTGNLSDQTTLRMLRNQLRNLMTGSITGTAVYKNLMSVGVKTNSASAGDISTSGVNTITFDEDKFLSAFSADSDAVKTLFIGGDGITGLFTQMETIVENALDGATGYFTTANNSYNKQISALNTKIDKATDATSKYQTRLESKFSTMDLLISNMQNQYSAFLSS